MIIPPPSKNRNVLIRQSIYSAGQFADKWHLLPVNMILIVRTSSCTKKLHKSREICICAKNCIDVNYYWLMCN